MADNTTLDPGTGGDVIATDDVAGVKYQRVKLVDGTLDSTAAIPGDATNGLDVDVTRVQGTVTVADGGGSLTVDNAGTFAVQDSEKVADNAAFTDGTTKVLPAGYVFDEVAGTALTENDVAAARIDSKRAQVGVIEDATTRGQRAAVSAANALKVDNSAVTQPVSNAGTFAVQDSEKIADDAAFTVATTKVMPVGYLADQVSTDSVNEGDIGAARMTLDRKQIVVLAPSADTEGYDTSRLLSAATTNATSVKASAGKLFGWHLYNDGATERYLKLYDKASAPTVGSDTPKMTVPIPAGAGANVEFAGGIAFPTGIAFAITTNVADADATAVALNEVVVNLLYK